MSITDKGIIFSADIVFSFVIILSIMLTATWQFGFFAEKQLKEIKKTELELASFFLADALIKNFDGNSLHGIAVLDGEKHRVKSNEISSEKIPLLEKNENVFGVWTREKSGTQKTFFSKNSLSKNCVSVERLVLVDGKQGLFGVKTCE